MHTAPNNFPAPTINPIPPQYHINPEFSKPKIFQTQFFLYPQTFGPKKMSRANFCQAQFSSSWLV